MGSIRRMPVEKYKREYGCEVFVETGTGRGKGLKHVVYAFDFKQLFSVEYMKELHDFNRVRTWPANVHLYNSDSLSFLGEVLPRIEGNILFWLDSHYPGADYNLGRYEEDMPDEVRMPLLYELKLIRRLRGAGRRDVIFMDDWNVYTSDMIQSKFKPRKVFDMLEINSLFPDYKKEFIDHGINRKLTYFCRDVSLILAPGVA